MKRIRLTLLFCLLILLALPAGSALAAPQEPPDYPLDRIITGDDFVLEDDETEVGDVVVFGGSAEIEPGAVLDGDLAVFGGDVQVDGVIKGSVAVFGGDVEILEEAYVGGDCALFGGSVEIHENATIVGDLVTNPDGARFPFGDWGRGRDHGRDGIEAPEMPEMPSLPEMPTPPLRSRVEYHHRPGFASRVGSAFLSAIGIGVVALLIALFWPRHVDRVRSVVLKEPAMSGVLGFLTLLAAGLLTPVLAVLSAVLILICIGLLGFPLIVLLWLAIMAAALFGWAAIGQIVGRWLNGRLNIQGITPMIEAGLGAFALALLLGLIQAIPFVGIAGGLLQFGVLCIGLGAVALTRFGRQEYGQGQPILPKLPSKPKPPASVPPVPPAPIPPVPPVQPADELPFEAPPLESEGPFPEQ